MAILIPFGSYFARFLNLAKLLLKLLQYDNANRSLRLNYITNLNDNLKNKKILNERSFFCSSLYGPYVT